MTTDIALMGPHALALHNSRMLALASFGVDPTALAPYRTKDMSLALAKEERSMIVKQKKAERELILQGHHDIVAVH